MIVFPTLLNLMEDFGRDKHLNLVLARNLVGILSATDLLARLGSPWITDGGMCKLARSLFLCIEQSTFSVKARTPEELSTGKRNQKLSDCRLHLSRTFIYVQLRNDGNRSDFARSGRGLDPLNLHHSVLGVDLWLNFSSLHW